ncbi:MAG TPA: hypothetical protein VGC91_04485 [Pyrinomonadaceae bacterium]
MVGAVGNFNRLADIFNGAVESFNQIVGNFNCKVEDFNHTVENLKPAGENLGMMGEVSNRLDPNFNARLKTQTSLTRIQTGAPKIKIGG